MFSTGFTMDSAGQAETMDGPTVDWLRAQAARLGAPVCGSLVIEAGGAHFNRFLLARPDGGLEHYDKRHLFRMAGEHEHYAPGAERLVFEVAGWRVCPQVCYDLRFPAFIRNRHDDGSWSYDLLLVVANWPGRRATHWSTLLPARAIENLACVAAVNIVGTDGAGVEYAGGSGVWDAQGRRLAEAGARPQDLKVTLSAAELAEWREAFPAWLDADDFTLDTGRERS
jgi:predicted amidohydrolase